MSVCLSVCLSASLSESSTLNVFSPLVVIARRCSFGTGRRCRNSRLLTTLVHTLVRFGANVIKLIEHGDKRDTGGYI